MSKRSWGSPNAKLTNWVFCPPSPIFGRDRWGPIGPWWMATVMMRTQPGPTAAGNETGVTPPLKIQSGNPPIIFSQNSNPNPHGKRALQVCQWSRRQEKRAVWWWMTELPSPPNLYSPYGLILDYHLSLMGIIHHVNDANGWYFWSKGLNLHQRYVYGKC